MKPTYDFPSLITLAAKRMREIAYGSLKLWYKNNGYLERNLTGCLIWAWTQLHPDGFYALEVPTPVPDAMRDRTKASALHIDSWLVDGAIGIACEAKQLYKKWKWKCIEEDIDRLCDQTVRSCAKLHEGMSEVPTQLYALLLADTWSANMRRWWETKGAEGMKWTADKLAPFTTGSVQVYEKSEGGAFGDYYWLYAWRKIG